MKDFMKKHGRFIVLLLLTIGLPAHFVGVPVLGNAVSPAGASSLAANYSSKNTSASLSQPAYAGGSSSAASKDKNSTSSVPANPLPKEENNTVSAQENYSAPSEYPGAKAAWSPYATAPTLLFNQFYNSALSRFKTYQELLDEYALTPPFSHFTFVFDNPTPVIFTGIPQWPADVPIDVVVSGTAETTYLAIGRGVSVRNITVDGTSGTVGGVAVIGRAASLTVLENSFIAPQNAIRKTGPDSWAWYVNIVPTALQPEIVTGVVLGAFDGGVITGDITLQDNVTIEATNTNNLGFLGAVVGAYKNASVGNITIGNTANIYVGYVQTVIAANEGSTAKNITTGQYFNINYINARYAIIGAASGYPGESPSQVDVISMRVSSQIFGSETGSDPGNPESTPPDEYTNVAVGSERASRVGQIRVVEGLNETEFWWTFYFSTSSHVTFGAYDRGVVGTDQNSDAIFMQQVSVWDNSFMSGGLVIGASKNATINGNVHLNITGVNTSYNQREDYLTVIGCSDDSTITGKLWLHAFEHAASSQSPQTIIGPGDAGSSVAEIRIDIFATLRAVWWMPEGEDISGSIFGSKNGHVGLLSINGDIVIDKPMQAATPDYPFDFNADKIVITSGNIIAGDTPKMWELQAEFYQDPTNRTKVPPWINQDLRMSVPPVNQYGDLLNPYPIIQDPPAWIPTVSATVQTASASAPNYTYYYGNDVSKYLAYMGLGDPEEQQGNMRPSWTPYIYPFWDRELLEANPFPHMVYLPENAIKPLSYSPAQQGSFVASNQRTSVALNTSLNLASSVFGLPTVYIYNDTTNSLLSSFSLTEANRSLFSLNYDGSTNSAQGSHLTLHLNNIPALQENMRYRAEISASSLHAEITLATSPPAALQVRATNPSLISWKFMLPAAPASSSSPSASSSLNSRPAASVTSSAPSSAPITTSAAPPAPPPVASSAAASVYSRPKSTSQPISSSSRPSSSSSRTSTSSGSLDDNASSSLATGGALSESGGGPGPASSLPEDTYLSTVTLGANGPPLFGHGAVWSLLNLLLAILATAASAALFTLLVLRRKQEPALFTQNKKLLLWGVLAIAAGVLSPILFLLTQNWNYTMVLLDTWTPAILILAGAQLVCFLFLRKELSAQAPAVGSQPK